MNPLTISRKRRLRIFLENALAGFEFLNQHVEVDAKRIGLIGHSEVGIVALLRALMPLWLHEPEEVLSRHGCDNHMADVASGYIQPARWVGEVRVLL